jgi:putative SOS response-associated peptidase YedK
VITNTKKQVELYQWGLVPVWAKDVSIGNKMINARGETLREKPAFKGLLRRKRCVVPASGFYEWKKTGSVKTPMYITPTDRPAFALAGLWDVWEGADASYLQTFTIITTSPNELMRPVHDRMPMILDDAGVKAWLSDADVSPQLDEMLVPYEAGRMRMWPVSREVNSPANDGANLIDEVEISTPPAPKRRARNADEGPGLFG